MKRFKFGFVLLSLSLLLIGCAPAHSVDKKVTVYWNDGVISFGGEPVNLSKWEGSEASYQDGSTFHLYNIQEAEDLSFLPSNNQGITEDNMTKYKKAKTYSEYMKTKVTVAMESDIKNFWYVAQTTTNSEAPQPESQMQAESYEALVNLQLTNSTAEVKFGNDLLLSNDYYIPTVTPTGALIQGIIKVTKGEDERCIESAIIQQGKESIQLMKYSKGAITVYAYKGYLITISSTEDIQNYITFL